MKTFPSENAGEEDLQTDADEDDAAQNGCLAGQLGAELFADVQTGHAEDEGDCGDNDRCRQMCEGTQKYIREHFSMDGAWEVIEEDFSR